MKKRRDGNRKEIKRQSDFKRRKRNDFIKGKLGRNRKHNPNNPSKVLTFYLPRNLNDEPLFYRASSPCRECLNCTYSLFVEDNPILCFCTPI